MKDKRKPNPDLETVMPLLIGAWRRFHKLAGPADKLQTREFRSVVEGVVKLQNGLEKGTELVKQDYFSDRDLLGSHLLYHWVIHYQEGLSLINEIPETNMGRVLDIGSGTGSFAFAALRHGAREVIALDRNMNALQLAAEVSGRYGYPLSIRKQDALKTPLPEGEFDLIILGHCLTELFPDTQKGWKAVQNSWIEALLNKLTPRGHLLIVDGSYTHANRRVLELRDHLVGQGIPVQAPCVWKGECPALQTQNNPCYAQRELEKPYMIKEIQRAAKINLSSLKMSYLLMKSPHAAWPELPVEPLYRVISPPIDSHAGKRYYLCGTDGKKNLGSHLTEYPPESRAFEYLKRGELIHFEDALERGNQFDVVLGTRVRVQAALGKPIGG
jgi:SAM-dependent methyltransferase